MTKSKQVTVRVLGDTFKRFPHLYERVENLWEVAKEGNRPAFQENLNGVLEVFDRYVGLNKVDQTLNDRLIRISDTYPSVNRRVETLETEALKGNRQEFDSAMSQIIGSANGAFRREAKQLRQSLRTSDMSTEDERSRTTDLLRLDSGQRRQSSTDHPKGYGWAV